MMDKSQTVYREDQNISFLKANDPRKGSVARFLPFNREEEKLRNLLQSCNRVLLTIRSVFPFDFFPDEISIDENKLNIVIREFFYSAQIHSVPIKSIRDIALETNPFFATMNIVPDGYPGKSIEVKHLWKREANRARQIIQGIMVANKQEIDLSQIKDHELLQKIEQLGKIRSLETN